VRARFGGPLVYSANWDDYQSVPFWEALDYVGIDAYFNLTDQAQPSPQVLRTAWRRWVSALERFVKQVKKPVLFTEIGLRSILGANRHPWDWNSNAPIDLREQANYYQAALETFWHKPWFYGFYWWAWLPYPEQGGRDDDSYSPHGKPAEAVLRDWYAKAAH